MQNGTAVTDTHYTTGEQQQQTPILSIANLTDGFYKRENGWICRVV